MLFANHVPGCLLFNLVQPLVPLGLVLLLEVVVLVGVGEVRIGLVLLAIPSAASVETTSVVVVNEALRFPS